MAAMPISAAGSNRRARAAAKAGRCSGFTLVELLVVITILALASAAVALALPDPRGRLIDEATRFAARTRAAHDSAIIEGRSISVWIAPDGYGFDRRGKGGWTAISDKPLRVSHWGAGVRAVLPGPEPRSRLIFDSTGLANQPLDIRLRRDAESVVVSIGANGVVVVNG